MTVWRWDRVCLVGVGVLLACGGGDGGGTGPCTPGVATQFVKSGGDQQDWFFNNALPAPYSATARDANNCVVPGVVVNWAPVGGSDGSVSPVQSTTNASGVAMTTHTLGSTANTQSVNATATTAGLPVLTFTSTAAAPPTSGAVAVNNNFFSPSSIVVQTGGTVNWTWNGGPHNVTYTGGPAPLPSGSATQGSGTNFSTTFTNVGQYTYHCTIHAGMDGTVTVVH
jgi:plastocyanin